MVSMFLEGRVQFKPLLLYGVMSLACWPLVRERTHLSLKVAEHCLAVCENMSFAKSCQERVAAHKLKLGKRKIY